MATWKQQEMLMPLHLESMHQGTKESVSTLAELLQEPRERVLRAVLLLLLTCTAGWIDMLSYLGLGHVFSSFMTGNFIFVGMSLAQGNSGLFIRASVALMMFLAGDTLDAFFLERIPQQQTRHAWLDTLIRYLLLEWLVLFGFAVVWQFTGNLGSNNEVQITLLGIAAFAMGIQGALVQAFNIPGVVADALTGTVLQLGKRFADPASKQASRNSVATGFLIMLCLTYIISAIAVVLTISYIGVSFIPVIIVTIVICLLLTSREGHRRRL
jgi:uncharacterized membrane protein YoaK (UPF0700 family)